MTEDKNTVKSGSKSKWPIIFVVAVVAFMAAYLIWRSVITGQPENVRTNVAQSAPAKPDTPVETKIDPEKLYASKCAPCHGGNLQGRSGIPGLHNVKWPFHGKDAELIEVITSGMGEKMPAFKGRLTPEEISAIATWLQEQNAPGKTKENPLIPPENTEKTQG